MKLVKACLLIWIMSGCSNDDGMEDIPKGAGDFTTLAENAEIEGKLFLPDGNGPFPVLIAVPGSGNGTMDDAAAFAPAINAFGFAFYTYNKRGIGASTGSYPVETISNPTPFLQARAEDVKGIIGFLQTHADIDVDKIGLLGSSQGTWVSCLAYRDIPTEISGIIMTSGGATSTGAEYYYEQLIETQGLSIEEANEALNDFDGDPGFDPLPIIEAGMIPMLFIYGGLDDSHPTIYDSALVASLNKPELSIHFYPDANHELIEDSSGSIPSDLFPKLGDWLINSIE